jgi:acetyl esterase/lipase
LRSKSADYAIDSNHIAALGSSAGSHLASMLGTASDVGGLDGSCAVAGSSRVDAVIGYFGAYDLRNSSSIGSGASFVVALLGDSPEHVPAAARLASPIAHVDSGDAPHLLLHGSSDTMVLISQSRKMESGLQSAGVPATLIEQAGAAHGSPVPFSSSYPSATCTTLKFLREQLG